MCTIPYSVHSNMDALLQLINSRVCVYCKGCLSPHYIHPQWNILFHPQALYPSCLFIFPCRFKHFHRRHPPPYPRQPYLCSQWTSRAISQPKLPWNGGRGGCQRFVSGSLTTDLASFCQVLSFVSVLSFFPAMPPSLWASSWVDRLHKHAHLLQLPLPYKQPPVLRAQTKELGQKQSSEHVVLRVKGGGGAQYSVLNTVHMFLSHRKQFH